MSQGPTAVQQSSLPPVGLNSRFDLTTDIWIERLDTKLAKKIIRACEPTPYGINVADDDHHLYAWVRPVPSNESKRYEGLQLLLATIALSRLVHPTTTGVRYCALVSDLSPDAAWIQPIPIIGVSPDVVTGPNARDWLTESEGLEVRSLMVWMSKYMHKRVHRAYWNHEYSLRTHELDIRWPLVVGGFEALLSTDDKDATWQFTDRVSQLASEFNIGLTEEELKKIYKVRSRLVHGDSFLFALESTVPAVDQPVLYQKLEDLLRLAIRRCLVDGAFHDCFKDRGTVKARWPLRPNPKRIKVLFERAVMRIQVRISLLPRKK